MHAMHGNGRGGRGGGGRPGDRPAGGGVGSGEAWQAAGRQGLQARELMEPQTAACLRAAGWKLPVDIPGDYVLRVYDTRIDLEWLRRTLPDLGLFAGDPRIVGGDFVQQADLEESKALVASKMERWGPPGKTPCHLVVPPRRHFARLLERAQAQLPLEAFNTWVTVSVVVPRAVCPQEWTTQAVLKAVPQLEALVKDPSVEVRVTAVGERPLMLRVPADVRELPPPKWEKSQLAKDRVLVFVSFRRTLGDPVSVKTSWLRDPPPDMPASQLELLRVEYLLPPATKEASGERMLRAAMRKLAAVVVPGDLSPVQLRQVQVAHGMMYAVMGVPAATARAWLRGSGCEGVFVRPFWTESTGADLQREKFTLLWVRAQMAAGARLWQELHDVHGFFGLYTDGKDVAIRVSPEADRAVVQAKVNFALQVATPLRTAEPGVRWWRLGPLTEDELWRVKALILETGLELVRPELRVARMGWFRYAVFFPGRGEPTKMTLDDGGWTGSEAKLSKAEPPARRRTDGAALSSQSTWGGPRTSSPVGVTETTVQYPISEFPPPASVWTPTVGMSGAAMSPLGAAGVAGRAGFGGELGGSVTASAVGPTLGGGRGNRGGRGGQGASNLGAKGGSGQGTGLLSDAAPANDLAAMVMQMQAMSMQMARMQEELQELRLENVALRQQLMFSRNVYQHNPYAPMLHHQVVHNTELVPPAPRVSTPPTMAGTERASGSADAHGGTPPPSVDAEMTSGSLGAHSREPGGTPDGKRQPRAARAMAVDDNNDV